MNKVAILLVIGAHILFGAPHVSFAVEVTEVLPQTRTQVIVREHPKTGESYVSIISSDIRDPVDPFTNQREKYARPDYRYLDHRIKKGEIDYDGPTSDRTKVYVLAATLATVGVVSGVAIIAAAPAATGAGAAGGAGVLAGVGVGVAAGTVSTAMLQSRPDPEQDDYEHISVSQLLEQLDDETID